MSLLQRQYLPSDRPSSVLFRIVASLRAGWVVAVLALSGLLAGMPAHAEGVEVLRAAVQRGADGVTLDLETRFELPAGVEVALQKGVALHFVAEADLYRPRWYWRDQQVAHAVRTWRVAYQPLTFQYRVNLGGLSQTVGTLAEALRLVQRNTDWRVSDALPVDDDAKYTLEVSYRLDLSQLPRPLLIGVGGQSDWNLQATRTIAVPPPGPTR